MIELVHVVVEVEMGSGKQNKHYAMSKWVVDGGKDKTKTCLSEYFSRLWRRRVLRGH